MREKLVITEDIAHALETVDDDHVGKIREAIAFAIVGVEQHRVSTANEYDIWRCIAAWLDTHRCSHRWIRSRNIAETMEGCGDGKELGVGGGRKALVRPEGNKLAPVHCHDDKPKARAFDLGCAQRLDDIIL
jgi:hypothetical protein